MKRTIYAPDDYQDQRVPIRPGQGSGHDAVLILPRDLTGLEAQRIALFLESLVNPMHGAGHTEGKP